jgi:Ca2+-binding RTX toxin-like protein
MRRIRRRKLVGAAILTVAAHVAMTGVAGASLVLLQPDPLVPATFVGRGGYSADGLGQDGTGGTVQAEVPAGSTVEYAFLYGTYFTATPSLADRTINFDGTNVVFTKISDVNGLSTTRAEVTGQVAAKVGGGGGIFDFAINTDPPTLDGVALVVIFSNPALPETTIAVMDGSASQSGDTATFNFAAPIDKTTPGFSATMTLGSGFSHQGNGAPSHICGTGAPQSSLVDVNGTRLTSCAGNFDDGLDHNGALVTVGGVGDSSANPSDPDQRPADGSLPRTTDDELYDIEPFITQGDLQLDIVSSNPSQDDNLFLVVIAVTAVATVNVPDCPPVAATITGTPGNDSIAGTPGPDVIFGLGGDDRITGLGGDDVICGGEGNDDLSGSDGNDQLFGGTGGDRLSGGAGDDQLSDATGNDQMSGGPGDDQLNANDGAGGDLLTAAPATVADVCNADPADTVLSC